MWWYYDRFPPRSKPREAKGGIKAQSRSGSFGKTWWAKRWIAVLESFDIGARLSRGRSYARRGQGLNIKIDKGKVTADVQGSRPQPYKVKIEIKVLTDRDWQNLTEVFSQQAIFAAKLLAGEMPQDIEDAFKQAKLSLFPEKLRDLETDCSCPDWSNPCKHIAAVYYLLGEEFDRDPFLLFRLRGMDREELIGQLGEKQVSEPEEDVSLPPEPLSAQMQHFWTGVAVPEDLFGEVQTPPVVAALPKRLGNFPFWRGNERFLPAIEPAYKAASARGMDVFLGEGSTDSHRRKG